MFKLKYSFVGLVVATTIIMYSCGTSNVSGTKNDESEAGFDPAVSSSLQVIHYNTILENMQVHFKLPLNAQAITMLNTNRAFFDKPTRDYNPLFAAFYTRIMAKACEEMDTENLFPDGPVIGTVWKKLTGKDTNADSAEIQTTILADVGNKGDDVKEFSLCLAVALSPEAVFTNFVPEATE